MTLITTVSGARSMIRRLLALGFVLIAAPLAVACEPTDQDRCLQARNPSECTQVVQAGGSAQDYLLYGMAGYMLSSAINGAGQRQPVIVADPHYQGVQLPIGSYRASPAYVHRSTTVVTTTRRGMFGGTHTTVRTTTVASRPSFGAGYRSSWSSRPTTSYRSSYTSTRFFSGRR